MAASAANRNRQSQTPAADPQKRLPCFACSLQIKKNLWNICQVSAYWKQPPGKSPAQKSPLPWCVDMKKSANTTCCQTQKNNAFPHQSCALCAARYRACHLHSSRSGAMCVGCLDALIVKTINASTIRLTTTHDRMHMITQGGARAGRTAHRDDGHELHHDVESGA